MSRFQNVFGAKKPVIAMVHLGALPGTPLHDAAGGVEAIIEGAARDLAALQAAGVDAVMFGNENDRPYELKVDTASTATMAYVIGRLRDRITLRQNRPEKVRELLFAWYKTRAREQFNRRLERLAAQARGLTVCMASVLPIALLRAAPVQRPCAACVVVAEQVEGRERRGAGERVAGVAVRMQETARDLVVKESGVHRVGGEHHRQRQRATGQALGEAQEVGPDAGLFVRGAAAEFLAAGGCYREGWFDRAEQLHRTFIARNLSPGGCADLLAATLLVVRCSDR